MRAVIPPTYKAGDPRLGVLLNGDALSDRFVLGVEAPDGTRVPNVIQQYVDDPRCTIILFENPPYGDVANVESNKEEVRGTFGWKASYVKHQMQTRMRRGTGGKALRDLSSLFIWSAFEYYLRQTTDSYVVFAPPKYFKFHNLVNKRFLKGYLFNRKHFHTSTEAGVACVLWSNEDEEGRESFPLVMFDIDKQGQLVEGATRVDGPASTTVEVRRACRPLSDLYDPRQPSGAGFACELKGLEAHRPLLGEPRYDDQVVGYLVAKGLGFENADLNGTLTTAARYDFMGAYLFRDSYLKQLPLFAACRFPSVGRFWVRGVMARCADNGDNFSQDTDFIRSCLIFTCLSNHNKSRSFTGTDGRHYRNELCFDEGTQASTDLDTFTLTPMDEEILTQWRKVLELGKQTTGYIPGRPYGTFQINEELNTSHVELIKNRRTTVYDYPILNGELKTLRDMLVLYHAASVAPSLI